MEVSRPLKLHVRGPAPTAILNLMSWFHKHAISASAPRRSAMATTNFHAEHEQTEIVHLKILHNSLVLRDHPAGPWHCEGAHMLRVPCQQPEQWSKGVCRGCLAYRVYMKCLGSPFRKIASCVQSIKTWMQTSYICWEAQQRTVTQMKPKFSSTHPKVELFYALLERILEIALAC
eukprot:365313-Chlamydomonas_euryale.AAC.14